MKFPAELADELSWYLERFAEPGEQGLVFVGPKGAPIRPSNFRPVSATPLTSTSAGSRDAASRRS